MKIACAALLLLAAACSRETGRNADGKLSEAEVSAEAGKLRLEPGAWETTTRITAMDVQGLPQSATQAATGTRTTTTNCITPAMAGRPDADILSGTKDGNCTYQRFSMAGDRIDAAMTCRPAGAPGAMTMTLAGTHSATGFAMGMDMKTDLPGNMAMNMKASVSGKRTGDCSGNGEASR